VIDLARVAPLRAGPRDVTDNTPPPSELAPDTFAARLYESVDPLAQQDPSVGWSLLILCNAIGVDFQLVEDWVRDTPDGPGWSLLLDVTRCPSEALAWLAQLVGVRLLPGASDDDNRARIVSTDGFKRGTPDAIVGAARATLTGRQTVHLVERDHDPADTPDFAYYLTVQTYVDQTPSPTATRNAILAQKPAGIVLNYVTLTGQTYAEVASRFATYVDVETAYASYAAMLADEP
jgi:hypothetical protein